jgi:cysteinyl-tRNA synthetase
MENAQNTVNSLDNTLDLFENAMRGPDDNLDYGDREDKLLETVRAEKQRFIEAMDDDFDTPNALSHLHAMSGAINEYLTGPANKGVLREAADVYTELLGALGLFEKRREGGDEVTERLITLITNLREELRREKNYAFADLIRDRLAEAGVEIQDTANGTTWKLRS